MIEVTLTWAEVMQAANLGVMRQIAAMKASRPDRHGIDPANGWRAHIEGAAGEMAFAKALGLYFGSTINEFKAPDVAGIQVRTRSNHDYELIVRADDADDLAYVLVTGSIPKFRVVGWSTGARAKTFQPQTYGGRPPAYFVPHTHLRDVSELTPNRPATKQ